jgi:hypothetical protein
MYNIELTTDPSAGERTCTQHTQAGHHCNVTTHPSAKSERSNTQHFSRVQRTNTTTRTRTQHTQFNHTQPLSAHLSCCVSSKPTWPHFIAAYFSFRFQYSRNSVLQMPTNTAK